MNQHHPQGISAYLQQGEVQARIMEQIQQARLNMAVTIGGAARLFNCSESQLREWERRGLLRTERPLLSQESEGGKGHRQFSQAEFVKLAIIRELVEHGYSPGEIPGDVQRIWGEITGSYAGALPLHDGSRLRSGQLHSGSRVQTLEERLDHTEALEGWRYFIAQTLRLCLLLLCEEIPDQVAGLVLPLEPRNLAGRLSRPAELSLVGPALVGWCNRNRSFSIFLTEALTFQYPTDYRLQTLKLRQEHELARDRVLDNVFLVLARNTQPLRIPAALQEAVRRLLGLVYQGAYDWGMVLGEGVQDWLYQAHELERTLQGVGDRIFNSLLERMIDLGRDEDGNERWSFCALLLPDDPNLPLQQQQLIVRAQTRNAPYQIGATRLNPQDSMQAHSLAARAFASGQVLSISAALPGDTLFGRQQVRVITSTPEMIARGEAGRLFQPPPDDEKTHSALALPLAGDFGISSAVCYLEAPQPQAFNLADQQVLRIIGRMLEELLQTSRARNQGLLQRENLLSTSAIVDRTFSEFAVEADFIASLDQLLLRISADGEAMQQGQEEVSLLGIEIDHQASRAMKYGNRIARNLSYEFGCRIRRRISSSGNFQIFHIAAERFAVLLPGVPLEEACGLARQLPNIVRVKYTIQPLSALSGRAPLSENMLDISDVSAHLSVSSYPLSKLLELLKRYNPGTAILYVRTLLLAAMDDMLQHGKLAGGDCIVTWDRQGWGYKVLHTGP